MKTKLLCGIAPTLFLAACGPPDPIPYECVAWVNNFYIEHPVSSLSSTAGDWLFRGAKDQRGQLSVGFLLPKPMKANRAKRHAVLNSICPGKHEKIWEVLPSEYDIVIAVWTKDNKFKDSIKC